MRKGLESNTKDCVIRHGTGGISIDVIRVGFVSEEDEVESKNKNRHADFGTPPLTNNTVYGDYSMVPPRNYDPVGRWPSNVLLCPESHVGFPSEGRSTKPSASGGSTKNMGASLTGMGGVGDNPRYHDAGSASRFFQHVVVSPC
jgi:hypothetical protein